MYNEIRSINHWSFDVDKSGRHEWALEGSSGELDFRGSRILACILSDGIIRPTRMNTTTRLKLVGMLVAKLRIISIVLVHSMFLENLAIFKFLIQAYLEASGSTNRMICTMRVLRYARLLNRPEIWTIVENSGLVDDEGIRILKKTQRLLLLLPRLQE